ncbi:tRNA (guanine-N(7)-)-methyltransferase non-catalytic subunit wuho [Vanessa atalanta]|uniref:tRNA (guanine-N(7)-)-methyltransferase non-catalytic subunit wuho n=1 Tax=Vanessa atalanta TaxID=42275 RepID=UPI001FCCEBC2|nr:tRNA (guanine-N(7)-)-methyltransferase non-catalytic subunit wuho [Vanessa atalanta]
MSLMAVSDGIIAVSKGQYIELYNDSKHAFLEFKSDSKPHEEDFVVDINISPDKKLLGVLLSKKIIIYDLPNLKQVETFILPRSTSKIRFDISSKKILVADKTGDVLLFEIHKEDKGTKILGHLSLLLNILQTNDGKYIITSDRDEKIRVSCFPNAYNIQTFCLGHKEFVMHIELLPHATEYLTSASGDGNIKIWDYTNGKLHHTIDTYIDIKNNNDLKHKFSQSMDEEGIVINSLPIVDYTITQLNKFSSLIALTVHSYMKILVYNLKSVNKEFTHNLVLELPFKYFPVSIKFHNLSLFVYDGINSKIFEYKVTTESENIFINLIRELEVFENQKMESDIIYEHNPIKLLFKRKFDNVQEYKERKKMRLEKPVS